jgi:hypothetical protein
MNKYAEYLKEKRNKKNNFNPGYGMDNTYCPFVDNSIISISVSYNNYN